MKSFFIKEIRERQARGSAVALALPASKKYVQFNEIRPLKRGHQLEEGTNKRFVFHFFFICKLFHPQGRFMRII